MENKVFKNKDVIQSYIITTAKYDYTVYEKRIIYRLVEMVQHTLEGKKLNRGFSIEKTLYNDRIITMPISAFLASETDENYTRVKDALRRLRNKTFEYENGGKWKLIGIIEKPNFDIAGVAQFELQPEVYEAILDFSKGFRKYELKTAMEFESVYAMRFYELMSGQKTPIEYKIENLKEMFGIADKYKRVNDFIKRVVDAAKKELDAKSPYTFDYEIKKLGRSYHSILFFPKYQPQFRDETLEINKLKKQVNISWYLEQNEKDYLINNLGFTPIGIKNNSALIEMVKKKITREERTSFIEFLSELKTRALRSNVSNVQGYIISALRSEIA